MLRFDHIAVAALTLEEGVETVETALGLPLVPGGQHPHMATHNRLLGLGGLYLEVIACDPAAAKPHWPRWFDLDHFSGPARLTNWVAACDDITAELARSPPGIGVPVALTRGNYRWQMAVPPDGKLPFDGAFPALIQWLGPHHPTQALPESHARLTRLEIAHPDAQALRAALKSCLADHRIHITQGPVKALRATIATPHGPRFLD